MEGQKTAAFEIIEDLGDGELDALCIPVRNAGNITADWRDFPLASSASAPPADAGISGPRRGAARPPRSVEHPETVASAIRIGNPARCQDAMDAMTSSGRKVAAVTDGADPHRLPVPRLGTRGPLRAGVGGQCRRAAGPRADAPRLM